MSDLSDQRPTEEELKKLSRYAIAAYAACAARMVQPLFGSGVYDPPLEHIAAVDDAIRLAEQFARKELSPTLVDKRTCGTSGLRLRIKLTLFAIDPDIDYAAYRAVHAANEARSTVTRTAKTVTAGDTPFIARAASLDAIRATEYAGVDVGRSLRRIYGLLEKYDAKSENPIVFSEINLWEDGVPPLWFMETKNSKLIDYWDQNKLNPWNLRDIFNGSNGTTSHVLLPDLLKTIIINGSKAEVAYNQMIQVMQAPHSTAMIVNGDITNQGDNSFQLGSTTQNRVSLDEFKKELSGFLVELKNQDNTVSSNDDVKEMRDRISDIEKQLQSQSPDTSWIKDLLRRIGRCLEPYLIGVASSLTANHFAEKIKYFNSLVIQ